MAPRRGRGRPSSMEREIGVSPRGTTKVASRRSTPVKAPRRGTIKTTSRGVRPPRGGTGSRTSAQNAAVIAAAKKIEEKKAAAAAALAKANAEAKQKKEREDAARRVREQAEASAKRLKDKKDKEAAERKIAALKKREEEARRAAAAAKRVKAEKEAMAVKERENRAREAAKAKKIAEAKRAAEAKKDAARRRAIAQREEKKAAQERARAAKEAAEAKAAKERAQARAAKEAADKAAKERNRLKAAKEAEAKRAAQARRQAESERAAEAKAAAEAKRIADEEAAAKKAKEREEAKIPDRKSTRQSFTPDQLVERYNNSPASKDFNLSATYDPKTNTFTEDVSSFGFTGDQATKTYTPEEFMNKLGYVSNEYDKFNFDRPKNEQKFTANDLVERYNNSPGAKDFNLNATYDPATNTFIEDVSAFGFTGDDATKTYTPEEFIAKLGYKGDDYNTFSFVQPEQKQEAPPVEEAPVVESPGPVTVIDPIKTEDPDDEIVSFVPGGGTGITYDETGSSTAKGNEDPALQNTVAPMWAAQPPEFKFTAEPVPRINPAWNGLEEWKKQQEEPTPPDMPSSSTSDFLLNIPEMSGSWKTGDSGVYYETDETVYDGTTTIWDRYDPETDTYHGRITGGITGRMNEPTSKPASEMGEDFKQAWNQYSQQQNQTSPIEDLISKIPDLDDIKVTDQGPEPTPPVMIPGGGIDTTSGLGANPQGYQDLKTAPAGFNWSGGTVRISPESFYNPTTGEEWTANAAGWVPPQGWVKGKKPTSEQPSPEPDPEPTPPPPPTFVDMDPLKGMREQFVPRNILGQSYDPKVREDFVKKMQSGANISRYPTYETPTSPLPQTQFGGYGQPMPMSPLAPYAGLGAPPIPPTGEDEPYDEDARPGGPSQPPRGGGVF